MGRDDLPKYGVRRVPVREALAWVDDEHAHLDPPPGAKFGVATFDESGAQVCAATVGRPVSRMLGRDPGVYEITRVACRRGHRGACSATVRGALAEAEKDGATRVISYTMLGETGACYRAARFRAAAVTRAQQWDRSETDARRRRAKVARPLRKVRWEAGRDAQPTDPSAWAELEVHVGEELPTREPRSARSTAAAMLKGGG
jgi:hypothetical protein